jgi:hypothetical protein
MPVAEIRHLGAICMLLEYSTASWHAIKQLTAFYNVIESYQLPLEISSGMPIRRINTIAAC